MDVWHAISYIDEDSTHRMKIGWTDIIATCVLKFKHHRFKTTKLHFFKLWLCVIFLIASQLHFQL